MTPDHWQRVKAIFFLAIDCPSLEERRQIVISLSAGDESLQDEVFSLLDWFRPEEP